MNIFIGFGYNDNDKWIKELVFPLVEAFDGIVSTGEEIYGQVLSQAVTDRIKNADGLLAFFTRRDPLQNGKFTSHRWVDNELITAIDHKIPAVEIREKLVDNQGGLPGDRQRIDFDVDDKASLLVELAKLLSIWRQSMRSKRFVLMPGDIVQDVRPYINRKDLKCTYQFMTGSRESPMYETKPFRSGQGLCVDIQHTPSEDSMVRFCLTAPLTVPLIEWTSLYESVHLLSVNLEKS